MHRSTAVLRGFTDKAEILLPTLSVCDMARHNVDENAPVAPSALLSMSALMALKCQATEMSHVKANTAQGYNDSTNFSAIKPPQK